MADGGRATTVDRRLGALLAHPAGKGLGRWWTSLLAPDWEHRLAATLSHCLFPAGHTRVTATVLWECPGDWAVELVGRLPRRRYADAGAVLDACRALLGDLADGPEALSPPG